MTQEYCAYLLFLTFRLSVKRSAGYQQGRLFRGEYNERKLAATFLVFL